MDPTEPDAKSSGWPNSGNAHCPSTQQLCVLFFTVPVPPGLRSDLWSVDGGGRRSRTSRLFNTWKNARAHNVTTTDSVSDERTNDRTNERTNSPLERTSERASEVEFQGRADFVRPSVRPSVHRPYSPHARVFADDDETTTRSLKRTEGRTQEEEEMRTDRPTDRPTERPYLAPPPPQLGRRLARTPTASRVPGSYILYNTLTKSGGI